MAKLGYIAGIVVVIIFALVVGVTSAVKAFSGDAKVVVEGDYIEAATADQKLGSTEKSNALNDTDFSEVGIIDSNFQKKWVRGWTYDSMPAVGVATTTMFWKNSTGQGVYIDTHAFFVQFAGTPSSSVTIACGTSTATGIATYTTTPPTNIIAASRVNTSSVSVANQRGLVQVAATLAGIVYVADGENIVCGWYNPDSAGGLGGLTEPVTSTARGYTATVYIPFWKIMQY